MSALQDYLVSVRADPALSDSQLAQSFPLYSKIHRRVECSVDCDSDSQKVEDVHKEFIGCAKSDEYKLEKFPNSSKKTISMHGDMGMSFSSSCHYSNHIKSAAVPFSEIKRCAGAEVVSSGSNVWINGCCFPKILCYSYQVPSGGVACAQEQGERDDMEIAFTVGDALSLKGKDDRCLLSPLSPHFSYFFDINDHGVLCLRQPLDMKIDELGIEPTFTMLGNGAGVLFNKKIFDSDSWCFCGEDHISVKFPRGLMIDIQRGDNLETEINKIKDITQKRSAQILWQVFMTTPCDGGAKDRGFQVGEVLSAIFHASAPDAITGEIWNETVDIIDENAEWLFGFDAYTKWDSSLRPKILQYARDHDQTAATLTRTASDSSKDSKDRASMIDPPLTSAQSSAIQSHSQGQPQAEQWAQMSGQAWHLTDVTVEVPHNIARGSSVCTLSDEAAYSQSTIYSEDSSTTTAIVASEDSLASKYTDQDSAASVESPRTLTVGVRGVQMNELFRRAVQSIVRPAALHPMTHWLNDTVTYCVGKASTAGSRVVSSKYSRRNNNKAKTISAKRRLKCK